MYPVPYADPDPTHPTFQVANWQQRRGEALKVNISAGEGLQDVLKSNLGPLGTIKMYVAPSEIFFNRQCY